jgi:uncharacterized protein (TIGR02246 family)
MMLDFSVRGFGRRWAICGTAWFLAAGAYAQAADEGAARKFIADYVKAWNAGDSASLNKMWADDGELVDAEGTVIDRKALMANRLAKPSGERPLLSLTLDKVRLLEPNVALVDGESELSAPDGQALSRTRFAGVLVQRDGAWRIRLVRQLSTQPGTQPPPAEPLKDLEWLVGEWAGMSEGMQVHMSTQWDLGNRYLLSRTEFEPANGQPYEAEVRIGWDPEIGSIKSWYFDSRGVTSTTNWQRGDGHWLGSINGVQSDGAPFTGTMAITRIDNDSYLRTLSNMRVNNKLVPGQELRMFRVPAEVGK